MRLVLQQLDREKGWRPGLVRPIGRTWTSGRRSARGAAAVELALLSPLLILIWVAAVDFARVYYDAQVVAECARTGALYAAHPDWAARTKFETIEQAALINAKQLQPPPAVSVSYGKDVLNNHFVEVTVNHKFRMLCSYGPKEFNIVRTARARLYPSAIEDL